MLVELSTWHHYRAEMQLFVQKNQREEIEAYIFNMQKKRREEKEKEV